MSIKIKYVQGHVEVYDDGEFLFSADNTTEAQKDLEEMGESYA